MSKAVACFCTLWKAVKTLTCIKTLSCMHCLQVEKYDLWVAVRIKWASKMDCVISVLDPISEIKVAGSWQSRLLMLLIFIVRQVSCPREISSVAWRISRRRAQIDRGPGTSGEFNVSSGSSWREWGKAKALCRQDPFNAVIRQVRKVSQGTPAPGEAISKNKSSLPVTSKSHRPVSVSGNVVKIIRSTTKMD